jgi:hypothetical protein
MQATSRIFVQTAPAKRTTEGLCPVKLCITHRRDRKYYSVAEKIKDGSWLYLSLEHGADGKSEIDRVFCDSPRGKYRDIAFEFKRITDEAEKVINEINIFSFSQFEEKFFP